MATNTTPAVNLLLPVASVDTEEVMGAALIQVTPAMSDVLTEIVGALRQESNKDNSILTRRCDDCEPTAWYPTNSVVASVMNRMEEEIDTNGLDYTTTIFDVEVETGSELPNAPEEGYPRGGLDGNTRIRAIDMHTDGENVWWTAIASNGGDSEDVRVQTSLLPLRSIATE